MIYLLSIVIDIGFAIWAAMGKPWYMYLVSFILLFCASSIINTSYIQGITRGFSFIYLRGLIGLKHALGINIITVLLWAIAYGLSYFVLEDNITSVVFFIACVILSTRVAFVDNQFHIAIERTKEFDEIENL